MESPLGPMLAAIANALATLDPEQRGRFIRFSGKQVAFLPEGGPALRLVCNPTGTWSHAVGETPADLTVHLTLRAVLDLATQNLRALSLPELRAAGVTLEGDLELARDVQAALMAFHVDWEEHLSRVTGDLPAYYAARGLRNLSRAAQSAGVALRQNLTDYLQFEAGLLPVRGELQPFLDAIDTLRDDVARLEAHIRILQKNDHAPG